MFYQVPNFDHEYSSLFTLTKMKNKIRLNETKQLLKYYLHTTDYKFQAKLSNAKAS